MNPRIQCNNECWLMWKKCMAERVNDNACFTSVRPLTSLYWQVLFLTKLRIPMVWLNETKWTDKSQILTNEIDFSCRWRQICRRTTRRGLDLCRYTTPFSGLEHDHSMKWHIYTNHTSVRMPIKRWAWWIWPSESGPFASKCMSLEGRFIPMVLFRWILRMMFLQADVLNPHVPIDTGFPRAYHLQSVVQS
jgi:hypothetical protein